MAAAAKSGFATGILEAEQTFYAVRYFKALDWYFIAQVPLKVVKIPAVLNAQTLAGWVIAAFLFASLAGILLITWFLKPMRRVSLAAKKLETFDFLAENTGARLRSIVDVLPHGLKDEVGQVSRAFESMISALEKNIRALKAAVARQHSIEGELNAAREIQNGMLPDGDNGFHAPGFEAAALIDAAKEVDGDFYDVFPLEDGREVLVLGDVSGKGVSAAMLMSVTLTLIRTAVIDGLSPALAVKKVNDRIAARNPSCMFATIWLGIFDPKTGRLQFCNGGHCPPLLIRPNEMAGGTTEIRWLREVSGPLVGALDMVEFSELETTLAPGETCLIYSDGVSETMNEKRELFGEKGIERIARENVGATPAVLVERLMDGIIRHRGSAAQSDDITMLVFERTKSADEARDSSSDELASRGGRG